jgi:hypothetical protein
MVGGTLRNSQSASLRTSVAFFQSRGGERLRVLFQKVRWASERHGTKLNLLWDEGEGYVVEERPEITDETIAEQIVDFPVPAEQRPRRHEETVPASPWQSSSRGGQKCSVGGSKVRPLILATKDVQLVTEHDDLEILGGLALAIWDQQP